MLYFFLLSGNGRTTEIRVLYFTIYTCLCSRTMSDESLFSPKIYRKEGSFVLKLDAFGLNLGRLLHDQLEKHLPIRIQKYICAIGSASYSTFYCNPKPSSIDGDHNVNYVLDDWAWSEVGTDAENLIDVPANLLEHFPSLNLFRPTESLLDFFLTKVPSLDKGIVASLKAEEKRKFKSGVKYHTKKRPKISSEEKEFSGLEMSNDDDKQKILEKETAEKDAELPRDRNGTPYRRGSVVVYEYNLKIRFAKVVL